MSLFRAFSQRLYLRIWLAVVGGVAVLTLLVGWAWRIAAEQNSQALAPPPREIVLRDAAGQPLLAGQATRLPGPPDEGIAMRIEGLDGNTYHLQMSPRQERGGPGGPHRSPEAAFWLRPPFGFLWMLGLVSLAVVVGVFPIIRRLLQRLETLQRSVQRFGEGDLSVRVPEGGQDEVADLARQFNAAAARIEALMDAHKSLLANASHELRSPLTRIRMGLELMGAGSAPSPAFRQEIERNIAELDQLIDEILLASRLDAREADMGTLEAIDLVGLAAEECARVGAELDIAPDA
ncbi:MAG: HAMP domain-containing protein, partial [Comamonadaceae bacterium]|nr:HAMP domain-containing protein [Comamonadaceae bacterium]